jgi:hypothetical protein
VTPTSPKTDNSEQLKASQEKNLHMGLAVDISNEILSNPTGVECKSLYKLLNSLNLTKEDQVEIVFVQLTFISDF